MTARDRYTQVIECSKCGRRGEASVSENDGRSYLNRLYRRIEEAPPGFTVVNHGENLHESAVFLCGCGAVVLMD